MYNLLEKAEHICYNDAPDVALGQDKQKIINMALSIRRQWYRDMLNLPLAGLFGFLGIWGMGSHVNKIFHNKEFSISTIIVSMIFFFVAVVFSKALLSNIRERYNYLKLSRGVQDYNIVEEKIASFSMRVRRNPLFSQRIIWNSSRCSAGRSPHIMYDILMGRGKGATIYLAISRNENHTPLFIGLKK